MKLKKKYSKQNIYSNQKFEDQIWYNQQIMTFLIFHNLRKVFSAQILQENTFLKTKLNFPLTGKYFLLTNFSNGKQTQESLESDFPETTFWKTNTTKMENTFLETKPNFSLTGKCFPLTEKYFLLINFSNSKQTQKSLKNDFLFEKQTWPKRAHRLIRVSSKRNHHEFQYWFLYFSGL